MKKLTPLVFALLIGSIAHAALTDSFNAAQIAGASVSCADDELICRVEIRRVRPMKTSTKDEATAARLEVFSIHEPADVRIMSRDAFEEFLSKNAIAP